MSLDSRSDLPAASTVASTSEVGMIRRIREGLTVAEKRRLAGMFAFITLLHLVGWGTLLLIVAPQHLSVGGKVFGVGLGTTAYVLGMRHAFDVDHIAAIDNTTRALMERNQRPVSVGFWFSLGHSSIVFALCVLLSAGIRSLVGQVSNDSSQLHQITGTVGVTVSGVFLLLLGSLNFVILVGIIKVFRRMRETVVHPDELQELLNKRGFLSRILVRVTATVKKPLHMYPVGLLFGFGFDTATEVSLLVLASAGAAYALPWYAIMCLPVLFAAGMCLLDTIDGTFMNFAYGWAFSQPVRKIYYNITITSLSVLVAVVIGGVELLSLLADKLQLHGGAWSVIGKVGDFQFSGYLVVGLFVLTWAVSVGVWKLGKIEQRWQPKLTED
ncbi:HoxN/HupN/NixA family nickel/cobalt transporter [soil metagenome]